MPHYSRSSIAAWRIGSNQALCSKKQFLGGTMTDFVLRCSTPIRMLPNHGTAGNRAIRNTSVRSFLQRCSTTRGSTTSATCGDRSPPLVKKTLTQGTRGESGRRWRERIWTTLATCDRTGRDLLDFLHQTLLAHWHGLPPPSLLETGSP